MKKVIGYILIAIPPVCCFAWIQWLYIADGRWWLLPAILLSLIVAASMIVAGNHLVK